MRSFTWPSGHPNNRIPYPVIPSRYDDEVAELLNKPLRGPKTRTAVMALINTLTPRGSKWFIGAGTPDEWEAANPGVFSDVRADDQYLDKNTGDFYTFS